MAQTPTNFQDDGEISSILAQGFDFEGELRFGKPVLVQGRIKGKLTCESDLFVSSEAQIDADIKARRLSIKGTVVGNLEASERLDLFKSSSVSGSVRTADLIVQSGARINAKVEMTDSEVSNDTLAVEE